MFFYKHFKGTGKKEIYFKKISGLRYRSKSQNDLYLSLIRSVKKAALRISASSWDILAPRLSARIQAGLVIEEWISSGQKNKKSLWVFSQAQLCRSLNNFREGKAIKTRLWYWPSYSLKKEKKSLWLLCKKKCFKMEKHKIQ